MSLLHDTYIEDYNLIFNQSLLIVDGVPFFIVDITEDVATGYVVGSGRRINIRLTENTSIKMPRLGYINYCGTCFYWYRTTPRKFIFGVNAGNTTLIDAERWFSRTEINIKRDFYLDLSSPYIYNTVNGVYPSFTDALGMLQEQDEFEVAFDRQFSVSKDGDVYYKALKVGSVEKDSSILLLNEFNYLSKALPKGLQ